MLRIAVYSIAKNEAKHVARWYESVKYADSVFVLDTGSEDNTVDLLKERDINVFEAHFEPFRFDIARNFVLNQISEEEYDYAVFLDMDEVLEPGWYTELQDILFDAPNATAVNTRMIYTQNADGSPSITYNRLMVTKTGHYYWKYPVHEVLVPKTGFVPIEVYSDVRVRHLPDETKSRDSYLELLRLGVQENPEDSRCSQYLAREYAGLGMLDEAIAEFKRHIGLEHSAWFRSESWRLLANCYEQQGDTLEARDCHTSSCAEAPDIRESWGEAAAFYFRMGRYHASLGCVENMLDVQQAPQHSIIRNDAYYSSWPHHMAAMCYFYMEDRLSARKQINQAFRLSPNDPAILSDLVSICGIPIKNAESET